MGANKEVTFEEVGEKKAKRIQDHRDRAAIIGTERAGNRFAFGEITEREFFETKPVKDLFNRKLKQLESQWRNRRLYRADFEGVMYEAAVKVLYDYSWTSEFYLYETIKLAIEREALDVSRTVVYKGNQLWANALPLLKEFEKLFPDLCVDVENQVTDRLTVEELMNHWSLTETERKLLRAMYENHDASLQELADLVGFKYKMEVSRTLNKIRGKLAADFGQDHASRESLGERKREVQ